MAYNNLKDSKNCNQQRSTIRLKKGFIRKNNIKVRVGSNYQADIPEMLSHTDTDTEEYAEHQESIAVWLPSDDVVEDDKFINYSFISNTQYGYNTEQTLGLLFHNDFNLKRASKDFPKYTQTIYWSNFEKHSFEIEFKKFGKNFEQIRKQIPDKSLKEIICYYYLQKHKESAFYSVVVDDSKNKLEPYRKGRQMVSCGKFNLAKLNNGDSNGMIHYKYCTFCGAMREGHHQTQTPICEKCSAYFKKMQERDAEFALCLPCPDEFHRILAHKKSLSPQDIEDFNALLKSIEQEKKTEEVQSNTRRTRSASKKDEEKNKKKSRSYKYIKNYETTFPITENCLFPQCSSAGILCPIKDKN